MAGELVLALNPGGGSTVVALFAGEEERERLEVRHQPEDLGANRLPASVGQVLQTLEGWGVEASSLAAVVGRGGPYAPLPAGVYRVDEALLRWIREGRCMVDHPSNLGAPVAMELAERAGCPAFVVDPVSVDELDPVARITGLPGLERRSLFHALNTRAVARRFARREGRSLQALTLVVAHLGSGVSVALIRKGRVVDVNNSADEGPFSARRAGGLPSLQLLEEAAASGLTVEEWRRLVMSGGGLLAHLGTPDLEEAEDMAAGGSPRARLVLDALAYNVIKAVGAMAAAAEGRVDGILVTGGMARSAWLTGELTGRLAWIAPVSVWPGEEELRALAEGALMALRGEVESLHFRPPSRAGETAGG